MKNFLLVITFILPLFVQAQFTDNFSDGDFTNNPTWSGDNTKWLVTSGVLQSGSAVINDTFYLSTPSTLVADVQWELFVNLDFSTSSNNYVDIYLVSDTSNLKIALHGYFVRLGGTPDEISLYRRDGSAITKIIDGVDGRSQTTSTNNTIKVKVTRTASNVFTLSDDVTGTGNAYFTEGTMNDATYLSGGYFGISVKQSTASFFSKHYFDDVYVGPIILDLLPPQILSATATSDTMLDLKFNEAVEQTSAETNLNYSVDNGIGNPVSATRDASDLSLVHLSFATHFSNGLTNVLSVSNVSDLSANVIPASSSVSFAYYQPVVAGLHDVVINEVLFHAQTGGSEFVELYNASSKVLDLKDIFIYDGSVSNPYYTISAASRIFLPGEYVAITKNATDIKNKYYVPYPDNVLQVTSMQSYLDGGDTVSISLASGLIIDRLVYSESWQLPLLNSFSGVSLERLNPYKTTQDPANWHSAAESAGFATPGYKNSQYDDSQGNGSELLVYPEIFSPDNDGYHDVVNLHYHFDNPGNIATVIVYDAKGRLIRNLVNNELLGNDGSFVWDGITNQNDKARIGMYVFYVEVYDINGDTKKYKKTCVLAGKL